MIKTVEFTNNAYDNRNPELKNHFAETGKFVNNASNNRIPEIRKTVQ